MATGTRLNMPAGIDANATNLTVFAERGLDTAPFYAAFESGEIVKVTTGGPDTEAWVVERGALSTTRTAHQNGERLRIVIAHEAAVLVAAGGGTPLPGVTSDGHDGAIILGDLNGYNNLNAYYQILTGNLQAAIITAPLGITSGYFTSNPALHDGAIGGNNATIDLATYNSSGAGNGIVLQRVPNGVVIPAGAQLTANITGGSAVPDTVTTRHPLHLLFFPDNGAGAPDFSGGFDTIVFPNAYGLTGNLPSNTYSHYYQTPSAIDDTYWLAFWATTPIPYSPFAQLDASSATVPTYGGVYTYGGDGAGVESIGNQPQIYLAYASDRGFRWDMADGTTLGVLNLAGMALTHMLGENGKMPPASPASITGTLTAATLPQLTAIVSQLLTALDAKGSITKSTT